MILDDIELVNRVRQGEAEAFEPLVRKYHRHLLNFLYGIVRDETVVEDLGQEVFIAAFRSLDNFDERRGVPFGAWLFAIARNRAISELRRRKIAPMLPLVEESQLQSDLPAPDEAILADERTQLLGRALEQLDEPFRTALLESLKGKSIRDIARSCSVPLNTVKTRLFRARRMLRTLFNSATEE